MRYLTTIFIVVLVSYFPNQSHPQSLVRSQKLLEGLNISTYITTTGIFNQNISQNNSPGFYWPRGSHTCASFTSGITIAAFVNDKFRMASNSWTGEYTPGYVKLINGQPVPKTDSIFRIYKINSNDDCRNSTDWTEWGAMIPYGAPYTDKNNNCVYDPCIDIPGVKSSYQTVFVHLTDGFPESHNSSEGFGGGTLPLNAELSITAWTYRELPDVQYFKFNIVNKNDTAWKGIRFSLMSDTDLGDATDDYIGCDTNRSLSISYNSDNVDGGGTIGTYGLNPPASGQRILNYSENVSSNLNMNSFVIFRNTGSSFVICERDPDGPKEAYNFMNGLKGDSTPFVHPVTFQPTKMVYSGDPDAFTGWSERGTDGDTSLGFVDNCNGALTGSVYHSPGSNKRFVMGFGPFGFTMNPLDTQTIFMSQMVVRGSNNFNSVTKLKILSDQAKRVFDCMYDENYCDADNIVSIPPSSFYLSNNYPNPFNPVTKIKYGVPYDFEVSIIVYDVLGNEIITLQNGIQGEGNYEVEFNGSSLPSGVYYLRMKAGGFIASRKMLLIK